MRFLSGYLANLSTGRLILWCYAIWYGVNVASRFDPSPRLWITSIGLSAIIGAALVISTLPASGKMVLPDRWVLFRLFLMPFCVSSFSALIKDAGYFLIFPPSLKENLAGLALITLFLAAVYFLRKRRPPALTPPPAA